MASLGRENVHVMVVVSLMEAVTSMEAEWSSYGGGQFKQGRMVMLHRQPF